MTRTTGHPAPCEFYLSSLSSHEKNRIRCCVFCYKQIGKPDWVKVLKKYDLYLKSNHDLLLRVQELIPLYTLDLVHAPLSVCPNCYQSTRRKQVNKKGELVLHLSKKFKKIVEKATSLITDAPRAARSSRTNCDPKTCRICTKITEKIPRQTQIAPPKTEISPHKRRKKQQQQVNVSPGKFCAVQDAMGASSRSMARGVEIFQEATSIPTSSPAALRRRNTTRNQAFADDFFTTPCPCSSDGAFYQVHDLAEFVRKCAWIRKKQVSLM